MIRLRRAIERDAALLFNWANEAAVRANSFQSAAIVWEDHAAWFSCRLTDPDTDLYIMEDDGVPIGQVRLTAREDSAVISYSIDASCRGRGYAAWLLLLAELAVSRSRPHLRSICGEVKPFNAASQKAFIRCGYQEARKDLPEPHFVYTKGLYRRLVIRADANPGIATGHLTRCISIAAALRRAGMESLFLVRDEDALRMLFKSGFAAALLPKTDSAAGEAAAIGEMLGAYGASKLLVDSYAVTEEYLKALRAFCKTIYMDDLNAFVYPADMLVHYGVDAEEADYSSRYGEAKLLLGCRYAPLRPMFAGLPLLVREKVHNALILTGGSDLSGAASAIAQALPQDIGIHIVQGRYSCGARLKELADKQESITLHTDVSDMAGLMRACDVAVSAGGVSLYELCACGVPAVCFTIADNQLPNARGFAARDLIPYAGDWRSGREDCLRNIARRVGEYGRDFELRRRRAQEMQSLVDGLGAERIAQAIIEL